MVTPRIFWKMNYILLIIIMVQVVLFSGNHSWLGERLFGVRSSNFSKKFVAAAIKHGIQANPYVGHVWHGAYTHAEQRMRKKA